MASNSLAIASPPGRSRLRGQLTPWEVAKARFLEGLDANERALFDNATPENLLYTSSNAEKQDSRDSKLRSAVGKIQPLVAALEDYGKALDVYAQIHPFSLSAIWGSIRVVLIMASKHSKFYSRMVDVFGQIGDLLPRLGAYERLFSSSDHPGLAEALSRAYVDVIEICSDFKNVLRHQRVSRIKRTFQPLSASGNLKFDEAILKFRNHRKAVEKEAEISHMIEEKKSREMVLRDRQAAEMRMRVHRQHDLISRLSDLDHEQKHSLMQRTCVPGTGLWAVPYFETWSNEMSTSILCCHGIAGSGKSILTSQLIDRAVAENKQHSASSEVAFIYCDYKDKRTLEPVNLFRSLIQQFLRKLETCSESILNNVERIVNFSHASSFGDAVDLLTRLIFLFPKVSIFVDGLDELSERNQRVVLRALWKLTSGSEKLVLKVYISAREHAGRIVALPSWINSHSIQTSESAVVEDVNNFVRYSVQNALESGDLLLGDICLQEEIISALVGGSKGMFLWVEFQIWDLCTARSDTSIRLMLKKLPRSLRETYNRFLQRLEDHEEDKHLVTRMFFWLLSARRPLTEEEMREAIAFTSDNHEYDVAALPTDLRRLIRACGNLIVIDPVTNIIQFAHYTVEQYLLEEQASGTSVFHGTLSYAENEVGLVCLIYLSFSDFERQITVRKDNGITEKFAAIEKAMLSHSGPANLTHGLAKVVAQFRRNGSSSIEVDYARLLPTVSNTPSKPSITKYALLSYIIENWLHHTASYIFKPDYIPTWVNAQVYEFLLDKVVFGQKLPFDIFPWGNWDTVPREYLCQMYVETALMLNHISLMRKILDTDTREYLLSAGSRQGQINEIHGSLYGLDKWLERLRISQSHQEIVQQTLETYDESKTQAITDDEWTQRLFANFVHASRQRETDAIEMLLKSNRFQTPNIHYHILIEATLSQNTHLGAVLCALGTRDRWWNRFEMEKSSVRVLIDNLDCNLVELATLLNFQPFLATFQSKLKTVSTEFTDSVFASDALAHAVQERNTKRVSGILNVLCQRPAELDTVIAMKIYLQSDETHQINSSAINYILNYYSGDWNFRHWIWSTDIPPLMTCIDILLSVDSGPIDVKDATAILKITILDHQTLKPMSKEEKNKNTGQRHIMRAKKLTDGRCGSFMTNDAYVEFTVEGHVAALFNLDSRRVYISILHFAVFNCEFEIAELLLGNGAILQKEIGRISPIHYAIVTGKLEMLKFGLNHIPPSSSSGQLEPGNLSDFEMSDFLSKNWPMHAAESFDAAMLLVMQWKDGQKPHFDNSEESTERDCSVQGEIAEI